MFEKMIRLGAGLAVVCTVTVARGQCDRWLPGLGDPGLGSTTSSVCGWDPDGSGPIAPRITVAARLSGPLPGVVRAWTGMEWEAVGPDFSERPNVVTVVDGQLVALGAFTKIGTESIKNAAVWDGSAWRQMGGDPPVGRSALSFEGALHVATVTGVSRWDGSAWQQVGPSLSGIRTLATYTGKLVAGGQFFVGGAPGLRNVAMLDGGVWNGLGSGTSREVNALVEFQGSLIAGGFFTTAGGRSVVNIARWDGAAWWSMGAGLPSDIDSWGVNALAVHDGQLIAAGAFERAGAQEANGIARWDGSSWQPMASGFSLGLGPPPGVADLDVVDGRLVAVGVIELTGSFPTYRLGGVAKWDESDWRPVGPGYWPTPIFAHDGAVVAPGLFGQYLGFPPYGLARWDGSTWSAFAPAPDSAFRPVGVFAEDEDGSLLAAVYASGVPVVSYSVAKWNGAAWSLLGGPADPYIAAIAAHDGLVVAGGGFSQIGSVAAPGIAAWNGAEWRSLATELNGWIDAVRSFDGKLIAGGGFVSIDGVSVSHIAQWDGSTWSALGGAGANNEVLALAEFRDELIAAGYFSEIGGQPANRIARWDGQTWSPLGDGLNGRGVRGLVLHHGELIAVGEFTTAGGVPAANIAAWNGTAWRALGGGLDGTATSAAALGDELLVTGSFDHAGGEISANFARWVSCSPCPADLNGDGIVDFVDYLAFLTAFDGLDPIADLNGDGIVDFPDYLEFLTAYDIGCP